jgi:hypothetical protein
MNSPLGRLLLFGLATALVASADEVAFSLSTTGSFSAGTPSDLTFSGKGTSSVAGITGTTVGGALSLANLGTFTLKKPTQGSDPYGGDTFTLNLIFFDPAGISSATTFSALLTGSVNSQQGSVTIDFGPARTFAFSNPYASGGFTLAINDLTLTLPHDSTTQVSKTLQGGITNAFDPPTEPVPEPGSIILLGSATLLVVGTIRRRQRVS